MTHTLADWWDPAANGFAVDDAGAILAFLLASIGLITIIAKAVRLLDERREISHRTDVEAIMAPHLAQLHREMGEQTATLVAAVEQATKPIQPTTNGGLSLSDLHGKVDQVIGRLAVVEQTQADAAAERATILAAADAVAVHTAAQFDAIGVELNLTPSAAPPGEHHPPT